MTDQVGEGRMFVAGDEDRDMKAAALRIPIDIRERLTGEQLVRLERMLPAADDSHHWFAYRISTRAFGVPFYVALFTGSEKRGPQRVAEEGGRRSLWRLALDALLFGWWMLLPAALLMVGAFIGAYLVKSWMGFDLFEDHFILHRLFFEEY